MASEMKTPSTSAKKKTGEKPATEGAVTLNSGTVYEPSNG